MIDYISKKLEALADSILNPLWMRILAARLAVKVGVALAIALVFVAFKYPATMADWYANAYSAARVAMAPSGIIPLRKDLAERVQHAALRLTATINTDLSTLPADNMTPWATAQSVIAVHGMPPARIVTDVVVSTIRAKVVPGCACWTEIPRAEVDPACVFISGWVLAAFARLDVRATSSEIGYVIANQNAAGWWPTFNVADREQFASTYSTAWNLVGLIEQKRKGFVAPIDATRVDAAITKATGWLLAHRNSGARWKAYPNLSQSEESESISGLVVHALHLAMPGEMAPIDQAWIDRLPATVHATSDSEKFYVELDGLGGRAIDHFVQITMPWMLVATVDAYGSGDLMQRGRAMRWMEKTLEHPSVDSADANPSNWWRAELLVALRQLAVRLDGPPSR